jgi:adenylyltransferase/sulfurtransferase
VSILKKIFGSKEETASGRQRPQAAPPPPRPEPVKITEISPEQLKARLDNGDDVLVVDLRQPWEYQAGHIPGAVNIFLQQIPSRTGELPKDKSIVLQCWHGFTSLDAAGFLVQNGWSADNIVSLSGGMAGWVQTHGPASLEKLD